VAHDAPIVEAVRAASRAVCGAEPGTIGHPAWMDAALLAQAGIPTVIYGPGGDGAHAVVEWADLPSLERTARVLEDAARAFCG
jgi:acetylornithine deacetylase